MCIYIQFVCVYIHNKGLGTSVQRPVPVAWLGLVPILLLLLYYYCVLALAQGLTTPPVAESQTHVEMLRFVHMYTVYIHLPKPDLNPPQVAESQTHVEILRNDMEALEGENRSLTLVLRAKSEQLENTLRQLEHVEEALGEAVQDGVCVYVS